ncbi:hypothetical protein Hypma_013177 [Hypsizygus marmoreus]|uniref:Uncharacterized protein n=1 Tax=Hypsizygus marmoreus TaxID=39966 RepID=A0A369JJ17_HYPMA|nr:hypothetical protein Hypma_013177 [Hypsizygus marmoreus]
MPAHALHGLRTFCLRESSPNPTALLGITFIFLAATLSGFAYKSWLLRPSFYTPSSSSNFPKSRSMAPKNVKPKPPPDRPSRQIQKKTEFSKAEVDALIADALPKGPPSSVTLSHTTRKGKGKRRASDVSLEETFSDIEEIDPPPPPAKKRRGDASNTSPAKSGPDASSSNSLSLADYIDVKMEAGTVSLAAPFPYDDLDNPISPSGHPVRNRVKTEKALNPDVPDKPKPTATPRKKKTLEKVNLEAATARDKWESTQKVGSPASKAAIKRGPSLPPSDNESLPEVSQIRPSPDMRRRGRNRPQLPTSEPEDALPSSPPWPRLREGAPESEDPFIDRAAPEEDRSGHGLGEGGSADDADREGLDPGEHTHHDKAGSEEAGSLRAPSEGLGSEGSRAASEGRESEGSRSRSHSHDTVGDGEASKAEDETSVMHRSLWDDSLIHYYENLPVLERFCNVTAFSYAKGDGLLLRVTVSNMVKGMRKDEIKNLLHGILFVQSGFFVNTARIDPSLLIVDNRRIKIAATKAPAVGIMMGLVTECCLRSSAIAGGNQSQYAVHRLTIAPAPQEMRRDYSVWGLLFGFSEIPGPTTDSGFSFSTFGEGKFPSFAPSAPSTPKKVTSKYTTTFASPMASRSSQRYDQGLPYETPIAIYDGAANSIYCKFLKAFRSAHTEAFLAVGAPPSNPLYVRVAQLRKVRRAPTSQTLAAWALQGCRDPKWSSTNV